MRRGGELIVVVGLAFEARIAAVLGVRVISRGKGGDLAGALSRAFQDGALGVVSFGLAGGLSPDLSPGTCVIGSTIVSGTDHINRVSTHDDWSKNLLQAMPGAVRGTLYGSREPVTHPRTKAALYKTTGAIAVDMESHIVGGVAATHGLPMAAIRVITDPAARALPTSVLAAMRLNGTVDIAALIWSLLKRPCDLPTLMRLALDARAARATLLRGRELLDSSLCMGDFIAPRPQDGFFNRPPSCGGESRAQLLLRSRACGLE
jgi:hopanoid-associated phosphorylase